MFKVKKRQAEETLDQTSQKLRSHLENTPLAVVEWDPGYRIKGWTKGAEKLFGFKEREVLGKRIDEIHWIFEDDKASVQQLMAQILSGALSSNVHTHRNYRKDGSIVYLEWYNSVMRDSKGKISSILSLVLDVTEKKEKERRQDEFISIASHELKTPLTTLKAYSQILEKYCSDYIHDQKALEYLSKMCHQVDKLAELVNELLDVSRLKMGKMKLQYEKFDLKDLLSEIIEEISLSSLNHKINFTPNPSQIIWADRFRLGQVINNLLTNAIKYSPQAKKVEVSLKKEDDLAIVSVKDFGIGIPKKDQRKIFEPFYRLSGRQAARFPGLGLGLHISSDIIQLHGGEIWVDSKLNLGSTFFFSLPINKLASERMDFLN